MGAWGATSINNYRYTGQEYDGKPTYAYNLRAREYYPSLGRFMQNDPIGDRGGSLNWYLYVANNPINATDPTGKVVTYCWDGFHGWLDVNGTSRGFYPKKGLEPLVVLLPYTDFPGEIRDDKSKKCKPLLIATNNCYDDCVTRALDVFTQSPPQYNFAFNNCHHVALLIWNYCVK